ncbi:MAG: metallophosphoesterase [Acidimicrobiales bacterium]
MGVDSRPFSAAHVAYLGLVVSAPMVGVGVLVAAVRRRVEPVAAVLAVVLLLPVPVGWYATHWAPFALRVDRAEVGLPAERAGTDPVRIGVLADLQTNHIGSYERRAVRTLLRQRPDLIVIPGDLFQGDDGQFEAILPHYRALLRTLHAPAGVFAVQGDSETEDRLERLVEGTGVRILHNDVVSLEVGDRRVWLGGNRLRWAPPAGVAVRDLLRRAPPGVVRVLVAHRPEVVLGLPEESGVDLVIAGHTHGGQVALPLLGPIVKFSPVSRTVAGGGLHEVRGNPIYVSTGAGMVRQQAPQVRFLTRPSVGLVTLR